MPTPPIAAIRRLSVARFISVFGSMAAYTALIDLVWRKSNGSTVLLSLTILLTIGAVGLFEPLGGLVADRWDRKRALIASDLASAALFVLLALVDAPWLILLVALLTAIARTPFHAGSVAAIPNLVRDDAMIAKANGWIAIGSNLGITIGPALGGILVGSVGAGPVFVLNAASFVVSAVMVWSIRAPFSGVAHGEQQQEEEWRGVLAGFRFLRRDHVLLVVTFAWMVLLLGMGLGIVADRPVAAVFDVGSAGFGWMLGLYGLGSVIGAWGGSRMTAAMEPAALVAGFIVFGAAGIGIGVAGAFAIVLGCNFVWGIGDAITTVAEQGIFQRRTPDSVRSRVVAANEAAAHAALMVGFLAAGPAIGWLGAQAAYAVGGAAALGAAALAWTVVGMARPSGGKEPARSPQPVAPWE
jgi:predicted MFS family arabinose efflux permease